MSEATSTPRSWTNSGAGFLELTAQQIGALIAENELTEVNDDEGA